MSHPGDGNGVSTATSTFVGGWLYSAYKCIRRWTTAGLLFIHVVQRQSLSPVHTSAASAAGAAASAGATTWPSAGLHDGHMQNLFPMHATAAVAGTTFDTTTALFTAHTIDEHRKRVTVGASSAHVFT